MYRCVFKSGIGKLTEWSTIQACMYFFFFNGGGTKGTSSSKILCSMFVYVLCKFVYRTDFVVFE